MLKIKKTAKEKLLEAWCFHYREVGYIFFRNAFIEEYKSKTIIFYNIFFVNKEERAYGLVKRRSN
jgi:hypothetical protein